MTVTLKSTGVEAGTLSLTTITTSTEVVSHLGGSSRPRSASVASSALSSILSSVDDSDSSEDEVPVVKRRRKNRSTPPTSIDEPVRKRAPGKRRGKTVQREEDVKDRKKYLEQGLYAKVANVGGIPRGQRKSVMQAARPRVLKPKEIEKISANFIWGLPLHYGATLLQEKRTFRLPWDILQDFDLSCLPDSIEGVAFRANALDRIGTHMSPTTFRPIAHNKYSERQRDEAELLAQCMCKSAGCDDSCINRMMQYFCSTKTCPLGSKCTNVPFNMRPIRHDLEVFWTGNRGFGLRTNTPIVAGEFIMEYRGEIISINESYRRVAEEYKDRHDYYFLDYFGAEVVDAGMLGNDARFINHSCDPNVQVVRWKLADYDEFQIGMFALRDIDAKEELSYDYGWQAFSSIEGKQAEEGQSSQKPQRCLCAADKCSGYLEKSGAPKQAAVVTGKQKREQKAAKPVKAVVKAIKVTAK